MKISEIPFAGVRIPKDVKEYYGAPQLGWTAFIKLPAPIWFGGALCEYINISPYGAIRFADAKAGRRHYMPGDKQLPESITETEQGYMIVPWGELQRFSGCGVGVKITLVDDRVVIDCVTKSPYNSNKYLYQVHMPIKEHNIIECHYYHCVSGYDTWVGCVLDPKETVSWPMRENTPYMKKALRFDTTPDATDITPTTGLPSNGGFMPPSNPMGPSSTPATDDWRVVYSSDTAELRLKP